MILLPRKGKKRWTSSERGPVQTVGWQKRKQKISRERVTLLQCYFSSCLGSFWWKLKEKSWSVNCNQVRKVFIQEGLENSKINNKKEIKINKWQITKKQNQFCDASCRREINLSSLPFSSKDWQEGRYGNLWEKVNNKKSNKCQSEFDHWRKRRRKGGNKPRKYLLPITSVDDDVCQFTLIKWGREKDHDRTWRNNEVWSEVITTIKEEKESKKVAKEEVYWERRWNGRWFRMWDSRIYLISKTIQIQNEKEKRKMQTNSNCKILGGCILSNQLASHIFWIWGLSTKSKIDLIKMAEFWLTRLTNKQENTPVSILENRTYQIKS